MNRYIKIIIEIRDRQESDILVAQLSQSGFEGFEEKPNQLHAFISEAEYEISAFEKILKECCLIPGNSSPVYTIEIIEQINWNAEWEKDFSPVTVGNFCAVRAHFHDAVPGVAFDLVITPKMSFGTGHHATTYMMITAMQKMDLQNKAVLDFGTGTGVLAILASKLGAGPVMAIDNDHWSIENAIENVAVNDCRNILVEKRDSLEGIGTFDFILANINLHVILENMGLIRQHLNQSGVFIASGVLESDEEKIRERAVRSGFNLVIELTRDNWMCFSLINRPNAAL